MSRTMRRASHRLYKRYKGLKVKDGSRTHVADSCSCNGGCSYCLSNRTYKNDKQLTLKEALKFMINSEIETTNE